jgi:hypothetical protein
MFLAQSLRGKEEVLSDLIKDADRIVDIVAYCFSPKRFEFLLTQKKDNGISTFMARFQNSFTRFFNSNEEKKGSVFSGQFRANIVEDGELPEKSKSIHRLSNEDPLNYKWSSINAYFEKNPVFVNPKKVLSQFGSPEKYKDFVSES